MEPTTTAVDTALINRRFTTAGQDPFDQFDWEIRDAWPGDDQYFNPGIETPAHWSQNALDIVSKLYLAKGGRPEKSIKAMVNRVALKITRDGIAEGYFGDLQVNEGGPDGIDEDWPEAAKAFFDELRYILVAQLATFNSPVWFNIGRDNRPQCMSACFLLHVDDNSESIMKQATDKKTVFKNGAGAGSSLSNLRGSMEALAPGGTSSGPVSFRRIDNAVGETFKSGGVTRRAADMTQLDADHPDIEDFVDSKPREEERLAILKEAGINIGFDKEGERNVAEATSYQSSNHSVRVTNEFMMAATHDDAHSGWELIARTTGRVVRTIDAPDLLRQIADAAWRCADPGLMFHDTINDWHTTPADGPIRTTNACGEIHTPDISSCNLAHLNVAKFVVSEETFDEPRPGNPALHFLVDDFQHVVDVMTTGMDIMICNCELPTPELTERTKQFRWLGLGYANMGAAIMSQGLAYDSDAGRDFAAAVTALLTGRCYRQSAVLASQLEPFHEYETHRESMTRVIQKHRQALVDPHENASRSAAAIWRVASRAWEEAVRGSSNGYRNAQATALAPTGTTSFMLDCDTTGIEPSFSLVTHKELAGGGSMVLVNQSVERALKALGYHEGVVSVQLETLREDGGQAFMARLSERHSPVFAGAGEIRPEGHVRMVAAVQPFLSGGVSKTINLASDTTADDIVELCIMAWKLGLKCISVYRDGSKVRQVHSTKPKDANTAATDVGAARASEERDRASMRDHIRGGAIDIEPEGEGTWVELGETKSVDEQIVQDVDPRNRMPRTRQAVIHKIHIRSGLGAEHEGYVHVGMYPDGRIGEFFVEGFGKNGGFVQTALGAWATAFSIGIQYGVPPEVLLRKHAHQTDETAGIVVPPSDKSQEMVPIRTCNSIVDYIARWLAWQFGDDDLCEELGIRREHVQEGSNTVTVPVQEGTIVFNHANVNNGNGAASLGPPCTQCGGVMFRAGSCWQCRCGNSTGCG